MFSSEGRGRQAPGLRRRRENAWPGVIFFTEAEINITLKKYVFFTEIQQVRV
jgi:hypothetical protein